MHEKQRISAISKNCCKLFSYQHADYYPYLNLALHFQKSLGSPQGTLSGLRVGKEHAPTYTFLIHLPVKSLVEVNREDSELLTRDRCLGVRQGGTRWLTRS